MLVRAMALINGFLKIGWTQNLKKMQLSKIAETLQKKFVKFTLSCKIMMILLGAVSL